ncbi:RDD family protein [Nocardioides sp. NPDC000445]|uniref:RDD family protein n=1 Tax=Nocardioides sp. NPDC000445 TaxID=3154257 RepID=UPI0033302D93
MTEGRQNGKRLLGRVAGAVTERVVVTVDPDIVLEHVDLNALLSRVDLDAVLARVDMDALLARVDLNKLLADVDLDALLGNVDVEALVRRSGIPDIVAESTYSMAGSALDVARRQLVGLDVVIDRIVDRLMRRSEDERRDGPPSLVAARGGTPDLRNGSARIRRVRRSVSGHYAGAISRAAAALIDGLLIAGLYTLGVAGFSFLLGMFTSRSLTDDGSTLLGIAAFAIWAFSYVFISLAITGRTIGKGLAGLRVVRADGTAPGVRTMFVRTLVFPLSVVFFGIGLLLIVVQREHRSFHDLIAKTCVVYDWGDRSAEMPGPLSDFLDRARSDSPQR